MLPCHLASLLRSFNRSGPACLSAVVQLPPLLLPKFQIGLKRDGIQIDSRVEAFPLLLHIGASPIISYTTPHEMENHQQVKVEVLETSRSGFSLSTSPLASDHDSFPAKVSRMCIGRQIGPLAIYGLTRNLDVQPIHPMLLQEGQGRRSIPLQRHSSIQSHHLSGVSQMGHVLHN